MYSLQAEDPLFRGSTFVARFRQEKSCTGGIRPVRYFNLATTNRIGTESWTRRVPPLPTWSKGFAAAMTTLPPRWSTASLTVWSPVHSTNSARDSARRKIRRTWFSRYFAHSFGNFPMADSCFRAGRACWGLLAQVTACKCLNRQKYYRQEKRNICREVEVPADETDWEVLDREPTPEDLAILRDTLEACSDRTQRQRPPGGPPAYGGAQHS